MLNNNIIICRLIVRVYVSDLGLTLAVAALFATVNTSPIPRDNVSPTAVPPTTLIKWPGLARLPGAFLPSRINLEFINHSCTELSSDLEVAEKVALVLTKTKLVGATVNHIKRYGYSFLKLEHGFRNILDYVSALLLCSGRGGELYRKFNAFRDANSKVWELLKKSGVSIQDLLMLLIH